MTQTDDEVRSIFVKNTMDGSDPELTLFDTNQIIADLTAHYAQKLELAVLQAHRTPIMRYDRVTAIAVKALCEERIAQLDAEIKRKEGNDE